MKEVNLYANNFSAKALRLLLGHDRIEALSGKVGWNVSSVLWYNFILIDLLVWWCFTPVIVPAPASFTGDSALTVNGVCRVLLTMCFVKFLLIHNTSKVTNVDRWCRPSSILHYCFQVHYFKHPISDIWYCRCRVIYVVTQSELWRNVISSSIAIFRDRKLLILTIFRLSGWLHKTIILNWRTKKISSRYGATLL